MICSAFGWATTYAGKMGWAEAASRGYWRITDAGSALLAAHPEGIPEPVYRDMQAQFEPGTSGQRGNTSCWASSGPVRPLAK